MEGKEVREMRIATTATTSPVLAGDQILESAVR
jgi:hypothetical protein